MSSCFVSMFTILIYRFLIVMLPMQYLGPFHHGFGIISSFFSKSGTCRKSPSCVKNIFLPVIGWVRCVGPLENGSNQWEISLPAYLTIGSHFISINRYPFIRNASYSWSFLGLKWLGHKLYWKLPPNNRLRCYEPLHHYLCSIAWFYRASADSNGFYLACHLNWL